MTPEEFAQVQRHIKDGLALNAELQHQQVTLLKNIQALLRGCVIFCGLVLVACVLALFASSARAGEPRSPTVKAEFQRLHPCPSTGKSRGACPGYVKDHVIPLCAGGADAASNMQWQTVEEAKAKDKLERHQCAQQKAR